MMRRLGTKALEIAYNFILGVVSALGIMLPFIFSGFPTTVRDTLYSIYDTYQKTFPVFEEVQSPKITYDI